jgi:hypothetical protein
VGSTLSTHGRHYNCEIYRYAKKKGSNFLVDWECVGLTVCPATGPDSLLQRILHRLPVGASSSNLQCPLFSLRSSSSCLSLRPRRPMPSIFVLSSITCLKAVPAQDVTIPVNLPSVYCLSNIPLLLDSIYHSISHTIGPTYLFHPSPAPNFRTSQAFLIYFPQCQNFSKIQSCAPNIELYWCLP